MPSRRAKKLPHVWTDFLLFLHSSDHLLRVLSTIVLFPQINPSPNASYSYEPFNCYCDHTTMQHALIRCGHPNDRPPAHPLYTADDALHRVWCTECKTWCFSKRDDCPVFKDASTKPGDGRRRRHDNALPDDCRNRNETCARMWADVLLFHVPRVCFFNFISFMTKSDSFAGGSIFTRAIFRSCGPKMKIGSRTLGESQLLIYGLESFKAFRFLTYWYLSFYFLV